MSEIEQHFVTFYSPGAFMAEAREKPIAAWDVEAAINMMGSIEERHGATPYGFRFTTRGREANELDSRVLAKSAMHYVDCKVETIEEIEARDDPKEHTLLSNMRANKWTKTVSTIKGWKWTQPLEEGDVLVNSEDYTPPPHKNTEQDG